MRHGRGEQPAQLRTHCARAGSRVDLSASKLESDALQARDCGRWRAVVAGVATNAVFRPRDHADQEAKFILTAAFLRRKSQQLLFATPRGASFRRPSASARPHRFERHHSQDCALISSPW